LGCVNFIGLEIESFFICPKDKKEIREKIKDTNLIRLFILMIFVNVFKFIGLSKICSTCFLYFCQSKNSPKLDS
tara:strand:+ start:26974 stop:27195 length:222 start_codon:yes stop_codon:yes gene_type:complete